jgi:hypothetical protein
MANTPHTIARQKLRLRNKGASDALALRELTLSLCTDELPARLNQLFDRYDEPGMVLRLGRIAVNVSVDNDQSLREQLARAITEQVEQILRRQLGQRIDDALSLDGSLLDTLCFYLRRGYLPWWALDKEASAFRHAVSSFLQERMSAGAAEQLMPLMRDSHARNRFLALAGKGELDGFLSVLPVFYAGKWREIKECLVGLREYAATDRAPSLRFRNMHSLVLEALAAMPARRESDYRGFLNSLTSVLHREGFSLKTLLAARMPSAEWRALLAEANQAHITARDTEHVAATDMLQQASPDEQPSLLLQPAIDGEEDERILIRNAGLVIVAPFLPVFFKKLGLLLEDKLCDPSRAVALLRYLSAGAHEYDEMELMLEKILCGLPLRESPDTRCVLSDEEKEEAEALLQSVIEHWSMLKNTSPDGLRHNFLQREGRLVFNSNQWELTVQKETHDILLDYLPWSISMIKLPWMKELLIVKWNT